jgi:hypothetical protein
MTAIVTEIDDWPDFDAPTKLASHYKITIALPCGLLHVASWNMPIVRTSDVMTGIERISYVDADWITDPDYGESIGWIDWSIVQAITWRRVE